MIDNNSHSLRVLVVAQDVHARRVRTVFRDILESEGCNVQVVMARPKSYEWSARQWPLRSPWIFLAWNVVGLVLWKLRGERSAGLGNKVQS